MGYLFIFLQTAVPSCKRKELQIRVLVSLKDLYSKQNGQESARNPYFTCDLETTAKSIASGRRQMRLYS